jgi:ankyrin repeat protein
VVDSLQGSSGSNMRDNGKKILFAPARNQGSTVLSDPSELIGLALGGDIDRVRECLSVCPDVVNQKEKDHGNVALHVASSKGNLSMASLLLSKGANLNIQDIFGNGALHYAVDKRRKEMAEMLLKCGADINLRDFRGNTPLHLACVNNDIDMVRLLLLHNANPELSDLSDVKPALKTTQPQIRALIEKKIQLNHGGDEDTSAKIVTMMSFGIGLGG